jgi:succinate dehydrogenase/fumarate reductase flavoprotein subunit
MNGLVYIADGIRFARGRQFVSAIDVLVVGSGAAGLLAAVVASQSGQRTVLVTKGQAARSGATATITGDCCVDGRTCVDLLGLNADRSDTPDAFFEDTVVGGRFLNDQPLAEAMIAEVGPILKRMREDGMHLGDPIRGPGHRTARGVWVSGMELMQTLRKSLIRHDVKVREEFFATDLLLNDGVVAGLAGVDQRTGDIAALNAKAVVLATGGAMMVYPLQTAPEELTGDGHSLALRGGAQLIDMEMIQFLPCVLKDPPMWRGIQFPWLIGPQSGVRAWLLNRFGERFMTKWDPVNMEFTTRDLISIACMKEIIEGRGGPNDGVYVSWAHLPKNIVDFAIKWYFRSHLRGGGYWEGFDFSKLIEDIRNGYAVEVTAASHFFMGGVAINEHCATRVPGLFACGEVAGGVHGANRLSGNATSQILVQGQRAGLAAARYASRSTAPDILKPDWGRVKDELAAPLARERGPLPHDIKQELQTLANFKVGMLRSRTSLDEALDGIRRIRADALPNLRCRAADRRYNKEWAEALECRSMADSLEATIACASAREESRGAHYRDDFPTQNDFKPPSNGLVEFRDGCISHHFRPTHSHRMQPPQNVTGG